jgi:pimeloyl-ACP methyl ester carboxylesterase
VEAKVSQGGSLYRLLALLADFKEEIADRAPDYFKHNGISLALSPYATVHAVDTAGSAPGRFGDYCEAISDALGIKVACVGSFDLLNPLDELFHLQAGDLAQASSFWVPSGGGSPSSPSQIVREALNRRDEARAAHEAQVDASIRSLERARIDLPGDQFLSYYTGGSGRGAIVIVNAFGQGIGSWKKLVAELIKDHRVIFWLPRGHDHDTVGVNQSNPIAVHAEDLERILAKEGIDRCGFAGWCTGPKIILDYYDRHPERVSAMMFLGATFKNAERLKDVETAYENTLDPLLGMLDKNPALAGLLIDSLKAVLLMQAEPGPVSGGQTPESRKQVMALLTSVNASLQRYVMEPFSAPQSVINFTKQLRDFWKHDSLPLLARVKVPVLLVSGQCDKIASPQMAKAISKMTPSATYLEVKGGSHYLQYERYEMLAEVISRFLNQGADFDFDHGLIERQAAPVLTDQKR